MLPSSASLSEGWIGDRLWGQRPSGHVPARKAVGKRAPELLARMRQRGPVAGWPRQAVCHHARPCASCSGRTSQHRSGTGIRMANVTCADGFTLGPLGPMDRVQGVCELGWETFLHLFSPKLQPKFSILCYYECRQRTTVILAVPAICHQ